MYRIILVPCLISCPANSPCPAMRDGPTRTRIFTRGCLLGFWNVQPALSSLHSAWWVTKPREVALCQQLLDALFGTRIEFHDPSYCLLWIAVSEQWFEVLGQQPVAMIGNGE